jgi:iron complex outermembrane recepter protein
LISQSLTWTASKPSHARRSTALAVLRAAFGGGRFPRWLFCMLAMPCAAFADGEPEHPFLDDNLPVVLSMTRMPQRIDDAPGAVTLITREDIERLGYRRLPQLLRTVPGMNVMSDTGHSPAPFYHGLGTLNPNRMQVLIDGRSVYSPYLFGYVDWDALPVTMDEIERVEVVRGSNAATYGSNAVAGVVNIVTRTSHDGPSVIAEAGIGSDDVRDASVRVRRSFGALGLAINARTMGDEGFESRSDDARLNAFTVRADVALNGADEINVMAGTATGRRALGFPFGVPGNQLNQNGFRDIVTDNNFVHLRFRRFLATDNELSVSYYRNEDKGTEEYVGDGGLLLSVGPGIVLEPLDYNRRAVRQVVEVQHQFSPVRDLRIAWGGEVRHEALESHRMFYLTGRESQGLVRASANVEWRATPDWIFNFGDMVERFQNGSLQHSPRLFATWHVTRQHSLKAGASRAYRQPSLVEERGDSRFIGSSPLLRGVPLNRTFVGNPDLDPERLDSFELGYVGQFGPMTVDVRLFRERFSRLVREARYTDNSYVSPNGITFAQGDAALIRGVEYQLRYRGDGRELWFSHALPRITPDADCASGTCYRDTVPSSTWSLTWMEELPRDWSVSATLFSVNSATWLSGSKEIDAYQTLDARIAKKFRSGNALWEVALAVTDIGAAHETFNDDQGTKAPFNEVPRQTRLTLRTSWF